MSIQPEDELPGLSLQPPEPPAAREASAAAAGPAHAGRWAVAAAAGTRLLLALVAILTTYTVGVRVTALWLRDPAHAEVLHGFLKRALEPWAHWDGVWFIRIAADGYGVHAQSQAFFPLYPILVRGVAAVTGHGYVVAGLVVSLACYAGAMVVLFKLAQALLGPRVALWTVILISVFPTALFFQAVYSESLFLLLTLLSLWWARRGRWALAGLAGLLAVLTRSSGVVLLLPLAVLWWEQRRGGALRLPGGPAAGPAPPVRRPSAASFAWLLLVPVGLGVYMTYLWRAFGDPLLFGSVQAYWGRELTLPPAAIWRGAVAAVGGVRWLAAHGVGPILGMRLPSGGQDSTVIANLLEFSSFVAAVAMLVACWRKLPAAYTLYALAALLFPLLYSTTARPLYTLPRFIVVIFPLFIGAAAVLAPRHVWRWVAVAALGALLVASTVLFASFT
ncbi:MAG: mannosyltransferase family protein [Actinobacteria bacterium]|nr:mannosyltransferase family protein [Actinomycetota bacterium]